MYGIERQEQILAILREKKSCSVTELAATLNYSSATVRRDLNILAKELKVRKTFGGAVIIEQFSTELPATIRKSENIDAKKKLCAAASSFITDNMTLFGRVYDCRMYCAVTARLQEFDRYHKQSGYSQNADRF